MLHFIDVSNHQGKEGMDLSKVHPSVCGVACKATEGVGFVGSNVANEYTFTGN